MGLNNMATNTYVALDTKVLASAVSSVTFNSISQGYTDLVIVASYTSTTGNNYPEIQFNGDTAANYSRTIMSGNGSTATSARVPNENQASLGGITYGTTSNAMMTVTNIMNYSNTTTYKTLITRNNVAAIGVEATVNLWRSTAAITSITYKSGNNFAIGSTFTLYGIAAESTSANGISGGTLYSDATYNYRVFTSTSALTISSGTLTCDILVVAGGGGGPAGNNGGGGGAGGLLNFASQSLAAGNYVVEVGAGGAGGTSAGGYTNNTNGINSRFGSLTAAIGGGKAGRDAYGGYNGAAGGSGGGAGWGAGISYSGTGGAGTSGQGYRGGNTSGNNSGGGGGGGFGAQGQDVSNTTLVGGAGGIGTSAYSSWGLATSTGQNVSGTVYYAGGGGGGGSTIANAAGGYGGGGRGGAAISGGLVVQSGTANTGCRGGGGGGSTDGTGGAGGSGIVIIRYPK